MDLFPGDGIFGNHGDVLGGRIFTDLGHFALDQDDILIFFDLVVELFIPVAGRADVDVEDIDLGIRILLANIGGLLQGGHAADVGAVGQVVFITGAGALDKGDAFGRLVVGRAQDFALGRADWEQPVAPSSCW